MISPAPENSLAPRGFSRRIQTCEYDGMHAVSEIRSQKIHVDLVGEKPMSSNKERSLEELYRDDPERADALVFGRRVDVSRRGFLGGAGRTFQCVTLHQD